MKTTLSMCGLIVCCAGTAFGGPIIAKVTGYNENLQLVSYTTTFAAGTAISLELDSSQNVAGLQPFYGDVAVHIYDAATVDANGSAALPTSNMGAVTLLGTAPINGRVRFLVSGGTEPEFPSFPTDPIIQAGAIDFGGLLCSNPADATDDSLKRQTQIAIAAAGEVKGEIAVGHVRRIQADNLSPLNPSTPVGTISANITAVNSGLADSFIGQLLGTPAAIEVITAANVITGNITARGAADASGLVNVPASIYQVSVGPSTAATGIRGNIIAPEGSIGLVLSTGNIGTPSSPSTILAGDSVIAIRTRSEFDAAYNTRPLAKDIHAHITAGKQYQIVRPAGETGRRFRQVAESRNGSLVLLETAGNVTGSINVLNIEWNSDPIPFSRGEDNRTGISVRGNLDATVKVWGVVNRADIIASRIT